MTFFADWTRENETSARAAADRPAQEMVDTLSQTPPAHPRRVARRGAVAGLLTVGVTAATVVLTQSTASADPSESTWHRLRECESGNNYSINTGNDHYGAYQFDLATWRSVGGHGYPYQASKAEQDARALILYRERGWQPWQCAGILGLHEDSDAGTGHISDISVKAGGVKHGAGHSHRSGGSGHSSGGSGHSSGGSGGASTGSGSAPAFPGGSHYYTFGDDNAHIKAFQDEMHKRGYFPAGTGEFGPKTLAMVKRLQRLNGLGVVGFIGPNTWRMAWEGRYARPGASVSTVPAFPGGAHSYVYGEKNSHIKAFQDQMHERGYFPAGTGEYGPKTRAMVKQLQRLNGLPASGLLGPNTWRLAWLGKYHAG